MAGFYNFPKGPKLFNIDYFIPKLTKMILEKGKNMSSFPIKYLNTYLPYVIGHMLLQVSRVSFVRYIHLEKQMRHWSYQTKKGENSNLTV